MVLTVNIGNSNIRFSVFDGEESRASWFIQTHPHRSAYEYQVVLRSLLEEYGIAITAITHCVAGSVVPELTGEMRDCLRNEFGCEPLFVDHSLNTGLEYPIDNPAELGADLLANAVAANDLYQRDVVVVDFGTALSFTVVNREGYLAGVTIAPGVNSALRSLVADTAQLPSIELTPPPSVIGLNTIECIQSGMVYGFTGLVESLIARMKKETGRDYYTVATGGLAKVFAPLSEVIDQRDDLHTLRGLAKILERNPF